MPAPGRRAAGRQPRPGAGAGLAESCERGGGDQRAGRRHRPEASAARSPPAGERRRHYQRRHQGSICRPALVGVDPGEEAVLRLYEGYSSPTHTGAGPRSIAELLEVLRDVRVAGVAMDDENTTSGIRCVAAPVLDHDGRPVAGIGVTFVSAAKKNAAQVNRTKKSVLGIGRELSQSFGYRGDALGVDNGISRMA
ncbi:hypothetical protein FLW16_42470 [Microbispora sp. KK1-11]|nr:hypothetical protein FLW16_42470 [Microbispora sp. KK1-11]